LLGETAGRRYRHCGSVIGLALVVVVCKTASQNCTTTLQSWKTLQIGCALEKARELCALQYEVEKCAANAASCDRVKSTDGLLTQEFYQGAMHCCCVNTDNLEDCKKNGYCLECSKMMKFDVLKQSTTSINNELTTCLSSQSGPVCATSIKPKLQTVVQALHSSSKLLADQPCELKGSDGTPFVVKKVAELKFENVVCNKGGIFSTLATEKYMSELYWQTVMWGEDSALENMQQFRESKTFLQDASLPEWIQVLQNYHEYQRTLLTRDISTAEEHHPDHTEEHASAIPSEHSSITYEESQAYVATPRVPKPYITPNMTGL